MFSLFHGFVEEANKVIPFIAQRRNDFLFSCGPNQTDHRRDQGSLAVKRRVGCANSVESIVAEKNSIKINLVSTKCFLLNTDKNRSERSSTCSFLENYLHLSFVFIKDPVYVENELDMI